MRSTDIHKWKRSRVGMRANVMGIGQGGKKRDGKNRHRVVRNQAVLENLWFSGSGKTSQPGPEKGG